MTRRSESPHRAAGSSSHSSPADGKADGSSAAGPTYVYCLAQGEAPPDLDAAPAGVSADQRPRALAAGDGVWLVASTVAGDEFDEASIESGLRDLDWVSERAMAHEAVVEHVFAQMPVVPLKLFTLFRDDRRALDEFAARSDDLGAAFRRLSGRVEMGLRIHFDAARADTIGQTKEDEAGADEITSGREYLRRKRRERDRPRQAAAEARRAADELLDRLAEETSALQNKPLPEAPGPLLLDAACLVTRDRLASFEALVESESRRLGAEAPIVVTLSGPFPPYHFLDEAKVP